MTAALEERQSVLAKPSAIVDGLDVTLPGTPFAMGHRHPISQTIEEFKSIMVRLGFDRWMGPRSRTSSTISKPSTSRSITRPRPAR